MAHGGQDRMGPSPGGRIYALSQRVDLCPPLAAAQGHGDSTTIRGSPSTTSTSRFGRGALLVAVEEPYKDRGWIRRREDGSGGARVDGGSRRRQIPVARKGADPGGSWAQLPMTRGGRIQVLGLVGH